MAKLTFLWYDIFVKKGSLQKNGMTAIPKKRRQFKLLANDKRKFEFSLKTIVTV